MEKSWNSAAAEVYEPCKYIEPNQFNIQLQLQLLMQLLQLLMQLLQLLMQLLQLLMQLLQLLMQLLQLLL